LYKSNFIDHAQRGIPAGVHQDPGALHGNAREPQTAFQICESLQLVPESLPEQTAVSKTTQKKNRLMSLNPIHPGLI
jgi:hypothetical protein